MQRKHLRLLKRIFLLLLTLPTALTANEYVAITVFAQEVTGAIKGVVKDEAGALVGGASVIANNPQRSYETTTDADGAYSLCPFGKMAQG